MCLESTHTYMHIIIKANNFKVKAPENIHNVLLRKISSDCQSPKLRSWFAIFFLKLRTVLQPKCLVSSILVEKTHARDTILKHNSYQRKKICLQITHHFLFHCLLRTQLILPLLQQGNTVF